MTMNMDCAYVSPNGFILNCFVVNFIELWFIVLFNLGYFIWYEIVTDLLNNAAEFKNSISFSSKWDIFQ